MRETDGEESLKKRWDGVEQNLKQSTCNITEILMRILDKDEKNSTLIEVD